MPLTAEQKTAIETLKGVAAEDAEEFRTELVSHANHLAHHISRKGFIDAEGRYKPRAEAAEEEVKAAEEAKAEAERKLTEAEGKQPDVAKIHADWQAKYDRDTGALRTQFESETAARKAEREARKVSDLNANLTGLDPDYARWKAQEHANRLHLKDDGTTELREPGSEVPVNIPAGKTPYQVLAEEIVRGAPAGLRTSNADSGGGVAAGGGAGGYDPVKAGKEMATAQKAGDNSLAFR